MAKEEYLMRLMGLEQEINSLEQQLQKIEQHILDMQNMQIGLEELEKSKEKEMYANLGKNVFIKAEIKDKNLLVDIGNKTFVKKSISETLKIIEEQHLKLSEAKNAVISQLQELQHQTEEIIAEAESKGE